MEMFKNVETSKLFQELEERALTFNDSSVRVQCINPGDILEIKGAPNKISTVIIMVREDRNLYDQFNGGTDVSCSLCPLCKTPIKDQEEGE